MRVSVCLGAILILEYLDSHSGYSAPRSRIARIYSGIYSYSGISQTNAPLILFLFNVTVPVNIGVNNGEILLDDCVTGDLYRVTILRPHFSGTSSCI